MKILVGFLLFVFLLCGFVLSFICGIVEPMLPGHLYAQDDYVQIIAGSMMLLAGSAFYRTFEKDLNS